MSRATKTIFFQLHFIKKINRYLNVWHLLRLFSVNFYMSSIWYIIFKILWKDIYKKVENKFVVIWMIAMVHICHVHTTNTFYDKYSTVMDVCLQGLKKHFCLLVIDSNNKLIILFIIIVCFVVFTFFISS